MVLHTKYAYIFEETSGLSRILLIYCMFLQRMREKLIRKLENVKEEEI